jgi:hypothetical protein
MSELVTANARVEYSEIVEPAKALSSLPYHFENEASELVKLLEAYYRFLNKKYTGVENSSGPSFEISNIARNHDIDMTTDDRYLDAIERLIGSYIPPSQSIDRVRLYKIIANYYTNRGSEESIFSFFRLFFNEVVSLFYPKNFLFTTSDINRSKTSDVYRLNDNQRWQNYSYVIYTQLAKSEWGLEYAKYIHPAGLKFFASLILELANNNDWTNVGCLDIDWSEFPNRFLDDVYVEPDGYGIYYSEDAADYYYYNEAIFSGDKIDPIVDDNCWRSIDWETTARGKHTPTNQSAAYIYDFITILSLLPDGGYHFIRNLRPIKSNNGSYVFDEALRAFYITYGISSKNSNTPLSIFREGWNGYDKTIDSASLGEYADLTLSDAFANPPLTGSGPQFNSLNSYFIFDGNYNSGYDEFGAPETYNTDDEASALSEEGAIIF